MDMTKFENADEPGFVAITGELRRWIKEWKVPTNTSMPGAEGLEQGNQFRQQYRTQCT
jgi:hypothetical protein